jgi:hypothetical protein
MLQQRRRPLCVGVLLPLVATALLAACGGAQPTPEAAQPTQPAAATEAPATTAPAAPTAAAPATQTVAATEPAATEPAATEAATQAASATAAESTAEPSAALPASEKGFPVGQTPEGYWYIGSAEAPVTLAMYSDFL